MKAKKKFRAFSIANYEAEEQWLREMHKEGWKFKSVRIPGIYTFEECVPEDVVYRLEFDDRNAAHQNDFQELCRDYGWNYLYSFNGYSYYCKKGDDAEAENELFTDNASRLQMAETVFRRRYIPFLLVFLLLVIPNVYKGITGIQDSIILNIIWYVMGAIYVIMTFRIGTEFIRMNRKYGSRKGIIRGHLRIISGFLLIAIGGITPYIDRNPVHPADQFLWSALPWISLGLGIALLFAGNAKKSK
ncbi:MAG: DUF2812 domain-containing protein [Eubacteriales bacterium]|nr:DUF2812 domain-containing protein [Eubacteriales bacterium]